MNTNYSYNAAKILKGLCSAQSTIRQSQPIRVHSCALGSCGHVAFGSVVVKRSFLPCLWAGILSRLQNASAKLLQGVAFLPLEETRGNTAETGLGDFSGRTAPFAVSNEADPDQGDFVAIANSTEEAVANQDGWSRIAAFGNWPFGKDMVQEFDQAAANQIVSQFKGALSRLRNLFSKGTPELPVYQGHPDDPGFSLKGHDDHTVYEQIEDMETRTDGLYIKRRITDAGKELLAKGKKYFSPRWVVRPTGGLANGKQVIRPYKLISAGLVDRPNIPGSAANSAPDNVSTQSKHMNKYLLPLLTLLGFTEDQAKAAANGADDAPTVEDVTGKAQSLLDDRNSLSKTKQQLATANAKLAAETSAHETTRTALATANASTETERKARATLVVAKAVANARVKEADRETEITALANAEDFEAAAAELDKREKVLPTGGKTAGLGSRKGEIDAVANAAATFEKKLGEFAASNGLNLNKEYQQAHARFMQTAEGRTLWQKAMNPEDSE